MEMMPKVAPEIIQWCRFFLFIPWHCAGSIQQ